jgi:hypothetical protein
MRITSALLALGIAAVLSSSAAAQDWQLDPAYGDVRLTEGFQPDPFSKSLTAGGNIAVNLPGCSYGHVANAPDIDFYYETSGGSNLYIYVHAGDDTTLLINTPNESWICNDDGLGNSNPIVTIPNAPGGLYSIWVGTYSESTVSATVLISEVNPRR